jgi:hypothetical protein
MSYYTRTPFTKGTLVRSAEANGQLQAIEEAFDLLPTEEQLKRNTTTFAVDTGTVNHLVVALPFPLVGSYPGPGEGLEISVQVANTNTGESDIDVDTLGVVPVKQFNGAVLQAGDLPAGATVKLSWNGDDNEFRLQGASPGNIVAAEVSATAAAASASAASSSASAASGSAAAASSSASTASGHAANASDSADAAAISASAASDSADAAAASAAEAAVAQIITQIVNTQTGALATGTTTIPFDNTIPQNAEGNEFMTLAITPQDVNNILLIEVVFHGGVTADSHLIVALFQDSTANALAAMARRASVGATDHAPIVFRHKMTAGTISPTTFKVRAGGAAAGTTTFNGNNGGGIMGGVIASSITITEIRP